MGRERVYLILFKSILIVLLGAVSYPEINQLGLVCIIPISIIMLSTLLKGDLFSFILQIFVGCHFTYGKQIGGVFTLSATLSLVIYILLNRKTITNNKSSFSNSQKYIIYGLLFLQILSLLLASSFETYKKLISILFFCCLTLIVLYSSKSLISKFDIRRFYVIIFYSSLYILLVALNQNYKIISDSPLFPTYTEDAVFEKGIFRSSGTLLNFEYFGEYSLGIMMLLTPGIVSGSLKKYSKYIYYICLFSVLISFYCIILSGTRSTLFLLPFFLIYIFFIYKKYVAFMKILLGFFLLLILFSNVNIGSYINLKSFSDRNENLGAFSFDKVLNGEAINRASTFTYGLAKISKKAKGISILIGEGYYTTREEYRKTHFDESNIVFPDYHNFYMSSIVLWGVLGVILFVSLFASFLYKGVFFFKTNNAGTISSDLICGFNLFFIVFLINQFKIQFIRDSNYFMLILIFLVIYSNLISSTYTLIHLKKRNENSLVY
ncbi:hypothetical protein DR864_04395 [Runella rosea]|uniref:O-antigen ligase-related domain-containing protein n=1 Tax=Runella rosea TaxID=2259595 RepID=A0A344TEF5_9BACT|nr:O-antigen ligase family protein [Runella rosea]AXE17026.1 hypothetical protein DR864_04395 [Runella rosea]